MWGIYHVSHKDGSGINAFICYQGNPTIFSITRDNSWPLFLFLGRGNGENVKYQIMWFFYNYLHLAVEFALSYILLCVIMMKSHWICEYKFILNPTFPPHNLSLHHNTYKENPKLRTQTDLSYFRITWF